MGTADRIERERLAKRARILDAARELFVERGIEAVTLREIAQRIEYSTTAIYVQFKDKQDLVEQMVREDFATFVAALATVATRPDPLERLWRLGEAYVAFALANPHHYRLLFMTPHPPEPHPEHEPTGIEGYQLLLRTVTDCIDTGLFRPEVTDPHATAQGIWAATHGLVALLIAMGQLPKFHWRSADTLLATALGAMLRGLLADPDAFERVIAQGTGSSAPRPKRRRR
ncbi:MAG: TetR/AcrR family transcriptional regulator [Kofleriaceae bacterium]|nr:TetR/AcrR family transcriptional regulator [Kofleriaceae bacterium]